MHSSFHIVLKHGTIASLCFLLIFAFSSIAFAESSGERNDAEHKAHAASSQPKPDPATISAGGALKTQQLDSNSSDAVPYSKHCSEGQEYGFCATTDNGGGS